MSANSSHFVSWVSEWLACAEAPREAGMIFVLAGRRYRKVYGLQLFSQGLSPKILLSVGRYELRRFPELALPVPVDLLSRASTVPPPRRHYFVEFCRKQVEVTLIRVRSFGTLGEIEALAAKLNQDRNPDTVLVVSSWEHLRRVRLCCRTLLPKRIQVILIAAPDEKEEETSKGLARIGPQMVTVSLELVKLLVYRAVLGLRRLSGEPEPPAGPVSP
jgi:hypothetical protein